MQIVEERRYTRCGLRKSNKPRKTKMGWKIKNANYNLGMVVKTNWFGKNTVIKDNKIDDIGPYDMLLRTRDISFPIPSLYKWISAVKPNFVKLRGFWIRYSLGIKYFVCSEKLYDTITDMDITIQKATAEPLRTGICKHDFFIANEKNTDAVLDLSLIHI